MKCAVIVGGMDMMAQSLMLAKKPHIIIATPGRLVDHLENTKGFSLRNLKVLVSYYYKILYTFNYFPLQNNIIRSLQTSSQTNVRYIHKTFEHQKMLTGNVV